MARALASLAWVARARGEGWHAKQQFVDSLEPFQRPGATWGIAECLLGLATLIADWSQFAVAAMLFGSVAVLRETYSIQLADIQVTELKPSSSRATSEPDLEAVRDALGVTRFETLWQAGRGLTVDAAVTMARRAGGGYQTAFGFCARARPWLGHSRGLSAEDTGAASCLGEVRYSACLAPRGS